MGGACSSGVQTKYTPMDDPNAPPSPRDMVLKETFEVNRAPKRQTSNRLRDSVRDSIRGLASSEPLSMRLANNNDVQIVRKHYHLSQGHLRLLVTKFLSAPELANSSLESCRMDVKTCVSWFDIRKWGGSAYQQDHELVEMLHDGESQRAMEAKARPSTVDSDPNTISPMMRCLLRAHDIGIGRKDEEAPASLDFLQFLHCICSLCLLSKDALLKYCFDTFDTNNDKEMQWSEFKRLAEYVRRIGVFPEYLDELMKTFMEDKQKQSRVGDAASTVTPHSTAMHPQALGEVPVHVPRVIHLDGQADAAPADSEHVNETVDAEADQKAESSFGITFSDFCEFSRRYPLLSSPTTQLQLQVQERTLGVRAWGVIRTEHGNALASSQSVPSVATKVKVFKGAGSSQSLPGLADPPEVAGQSPTETHAAMEHVKQLEREVVTGAQHESAGSGIRRLVGAADGPAEMAGSDMEEREKEFFPKPLETDSSIETGPALDAFGGAVQPLPMLLAELSERISSVEYAEMTKNDPAVARVYSLSSDSEAGDALFDREEETKEHTALDVPASSDDLLAKPRSPSQKQRVATPVRQGRLMLPEVFHPYLERAASDPEAKNGLHGVVSGLSEDSAPGAEHQEHLDTWDRRSARASVRSASRRATDPRLREAPEDAPASTEAVQDLQKRFSFKNDPDGQRAARLAKLVHSMSSKNGLYVPPPEPGAIRAKLASQENIQAAEQKTT